MIKAIVMMVVGTLLLIGATVTGVGVLRFISASTVTGGRVIALNAGGSHPQIEFTTSAGERVSYPQGGFIAGYKPGDAVRVRYRASDPHRTATVDRLGALWFWSILLALLGLGGLWAGWSSLPDNEKAVEHVV